MSRDDDAPEERARVYRKIAPLVLAFARERPSQAFHAEDLRLYVRQYEPTFAPDSPGRCLRELRLEGKLDYVVIDRHNSLYQFRPLGFRNWQKGDDV
jgi:hypothetical protein